MGEAEQHLILQVKQLLLRVPDELHERLARRAIAEGTSVNALATGVLDVAVTDVARDPRSMVRARASAAGLSVSAVGLSSTSVPTHAEVCRLLANLTLGADELINEQREPL
ncbi:MAG: toxin-antitoxin system HicB family antitoxin [Ilumatobacteraceae bacterium]|nr:toxin-antitoxin system HicB family antitoxin [Ilumatobacteraceae bacterium]